MKVGIVSQYNTDNMGNKLQNYALQQVLRQYADIVITIINKPNPKNVVDYLKRFTPITESVWINKLLGKDRKVEFLRFHNQHIQSSRFDYWINKHYPSLRVVDRCDLYCAGSDQVWKPGSGRSGLIHYLGFADRERTFSYAASFGIDHFPEGHKELACRGLKHIKHISVREEAGKRIVEEMTGRTDAQVLVDPTMLLTIQEWDEVSCKPRNPLPEKYLLTYFLGKVSDERREAIQKKQRS